MIFEYNSFSSWCLCDRASSVKQRKQPTRCNSFFDLLISLIQPYTFRAKNSPIIRSTFWLYTKLLVQCTDTAADRCIITKAVHTVKNCSWGWANLSPETCKAELKRSTLILRRSRTGTVWFYTSTSNKRPAQPKLYTKSLTRDLKRMYSRLTLVRISINL